MFISRSLFQLLRPSEIGGPDTFLPGLNAHLPLASRVDRGLCQLIPASAHNARLNTTLVEAMDG